MHSLQQAHNHNFELTFHSKLGKEWIPTPDQNKFSGVLNSWWSRKNQTFLTIRGNQTSQKEILLERSTEHCLWLYSSLGKYPFLEKEDQLSQCQRQTSKHRWCYKEIIFKQSAVVICNHKNTKTYSAHRSDNVIRWTGLSFWSGRNNLLLIWHHLDHTSVPHTSANV